MQTKFILFSFIFFSFLLGQSQTLTSDRAEEFLKTTSSLKLDKLKLDKIDALIDKTSDFTFSTDSINPILLSKLFKLRGDLRLEQFQKKLKLIYTYSREEIKDAEYSYERASELDPSVKCNCLKMLKKLYELDLFGVENPEQKMSETKRLIKENC